MQLGTYGVQHIDPLQKKKGGVVYASFGNPSFDTSVLWSNANAVIRNYGNDTP